MNPDEFWMLAGEHCTELELEALRLSAAGLSYRQGARHLGITKNAYARRMKRARERMTTRKYPRSGTRLR